MWRRAVATDLRENPALWWLLNYKDSRWAEAGIDAELKRRGLFDPATVTVKDITVPVPRGDLDAADGGRHRETARQCEAAAPPRPLPASCAIASVAKGVDYGPALDGFAAARRGKP